MDDGEADKKKLAVTEDQRATLQKQLTATTNEAQQAAAAAEVLLASKASQIVQLQSMLERDRELARDLADRSASAEAERQQADAEHEAAKTRLQAEVAMLRAELADARRQSSIIEPELRDAIDRAEKVRLPTLP